MVSTLDKLQQVGFVILLVGSWLNPLTGGPSPAVYPWLISAVCGVLLWVRRRQLTVHFIATTWLAAAAVSSLMGLLQYFGFSAELHGLVHTTGVGDAFANLRQRNQYATLTSIGLTALLWFSSQPAPSTTTTIRRSTPVWTYAVALVLAVGNATSNSRTGMLQWCLVFVWVQLSGQKTNQATKALCAAALLAYALTTLALPMALEAFTGNAYGGLLARFEEQPGCSSRSVMWANVLHLIARKPWLGWGWGELDYGHFITLYPSKRFCEILDNAHNLPLHLAVELGVTSAILLMGLLVLWVARARPWAEAHPTRQMAWLVLAVIGIHSLLEYPLWYGPFQVAVGLCVLLFVRTAAVQNGVGVPARLFQTPWSPKPWLERVFATLLLAILIGAAWDYWRVSQLYLLPADRAEAYRDNTLAKVRNSWFFQDQVQFAELTTVTLNSQNAVEHYAQALRLLHFSPEPRVVEAVIESAVMLGKDQEALYYLQRYQAAFPQDHAKWVARSARFKTP